MGRPVGSKSRPGSKRPGPAKGTPKPPIDRVCKYCDNHYVGFNGTHYCSDVCVFKANCAPQPNGCWEWTGYKPKTGRRAGYGEFYAKDKTRSLAHRAALKLLVGVDPGEQCVLHKCDNPGCVNPDHLWLGTREENNADRDAKGRHGSKRKHAA